MVPSGYYIVLVEPRHDGNVGSVARVMKNFGFRNLVLVKPPPLGSEARAMSMHGREIMENAVRLDSFGELEGMFDFLIATSAVVAADKNYVRTPVLPEHVKKNLEAVEGKIALVFGREDKGLSNSEIDSCDLLLNVPASPDYPTMNLSHSVAVVLYELSRSFWTGRLKKKKKLQELSGVEKRILLEAFGRLVDLATQKEFDRKLAKKTFRHVVSRAFISSGEASTLIGIFRKAGEALARKPV